MFGSSWVLLLYSPYDNDSSLLDHLYSPHQTFKTEEDVQICLKNHRQVQLTPNRTRFSSSDQHQDQIHHVNSSQHSSNSRGNDIWTMVSDPAHVFVL